MKILAFAGSNSKNSINKILVTYATDLLENAEVEIIDLNDYEIPLYSVDKETQIGKSEIAQTFLDKVQKSDAIVISLAEHNGSYSVAYKNIFDWVSRIKQKVYENKDMILLATSPGPSGGKNVLAYAVNSMPFFGANVKANFSLPNFYSSFDIKQNKIIQKELNDELIKTMYSLIG